MRFKLSAAIVLVGGLLVTGVAIGTVEAATPNATVNSAFAVRGPHDDLSEGADVIGVANSVKVNGVETPEVNFLGPGDPGTRSELDLLGDQINGLAAGTYPVSSSKATGTVDVVSNLDGVGCGEATGGTATILTPPTYTGSTLDSFAADFALHCDGTADYFIQLRYNDTHSWSQLVASGLPQDVSATVGSTQDETVTFTAHGSIPIVPGAASLTSDSWEGYPYWHLVSDGCAHNTLAPGASCSVDVQFAPKVANGTPCGPESATVTVPDGRPAPDVARFDGCAYPLAGQAGPPQVTAYFHHLVLAWNRPGLPLPGLNSSSPPIYDVYLITSTGKTLVTTTGFNTVVIGGLSTGSPQQYEVQAVYDTDNGDTPVDGPMSLPGTPTAPTAQELIYSNGNQVMEQSSTAAGPARSIGLAMPGNTVSGISVGADERYLAAATQSQSQPIDQVTVAPVDGSSGPVLIADGAYSFDTQPAVAPDSSAVIYTATTTFGSTATVLRSWQRSTGTITTVPGSTGLSQAAYSADGKSLVAVSGTHLVRLVLATGTVTTIAGGTDAGQPAVASDGRIAFVHHTSGSDNTTLDVLAAGATTPTVVAGPPTGINEQPSWDPSGTALDYVHRDAADTVPYLRRVTIGGADSTVLNDGETYFGAPVVVGVSDTTAPTVTVTSPASGTWHTSFTTTVSVGWTATDSGTGMASSDVRYQTAAYGHGLGAWVYPSADQALIGKTSVSLSNPAGTTTCVEVRSRDKAGNVSAWSSNRCLTADLDDRALTGSASVVRGTNTAYLSGTYSLLEKSGAFLTKTGATGKHVKIVATTCSTCGSVKVYIGTTYLGTVSLHSATTVHKVVFALPAQSVVRTGTLEIKSTSAAHDFIDGFAVSP